MKNLENLNLIYMFSYQVPALSEKEGIAKVAPLITKCRTFAKGLGILMHSCHFGAFDGYFYIRIIFNINLPQDAILVKVIATLAFAESLKLRLFNQLILSEKK